MTLLFFTVSLGNLQNSRRHTNSGWKMIAVFPIINEDDGLYKEYKIDFALRKLNLFQECARELLQPIKEAYYNPFTICCADGKIRKIKLVVANWLGDREEHERVCRMVGVSEYVLFCAHKCMLLTYMCNRIF